MKIIHLIMITFLFFSCRREKDNKNFPVVKQDIKGIIINNCTDSGCARIKIFLNILDQKKMIFATETTSDSMGEFVFPNIDIYYNDEYTYYIQILDGGGTQFSIDGTLMYFTAKESSLYLKPRVTPRFNQLCYNPLISFPISQPDSLYIFFQQRVFHKNVPDLPFSGKITNRSTFQSCTSGYPMGMWTFEIKKWKSGIYTHTWDSLYLGWGDTKTYTVNW